MASGFLASQAAAAAGLGGAAGVLPLGGGGAVSVGVTVGQGGPGTGKTAVALHRVAYLLYTNRERIERSGVLIIGPSARFLRYIGDVLPGLGERSVRMSRIVDLLGDGGGRSVLVTGAAGAVGGFAVPRHPAPGPRVTAPQRRVGPSIKQASSS